MADKSKKKAKKKPPTKKGTLAALDKAYQIAKKYNLDFSYLKT